MNVLYIPKVVNEENIRLLLDKYFSHNANKPILRIGLLYLLDYLSQKWLSKESSSGGCKLHYTVLRKMINHRHASEMLIALRKEKIIYLTQGFFPGKNSNTYQFSNDIIAGGFKKKIDENFDRPSFYHQEKAGNVQRLLKSENILERNTVKSLLSLNLPKIENLDLSLLNESQKNSREFVLDSMASRLFHFKFDSFNRLHSNFTNLPKDIRKFTMADGCDIYGLDVKSCFPTLLWSFARYSAEKDKYEKWLRDGQFYENLMMRIGMDEEFRDYFKKEFNAWINGGTRNDVHLAMKTEFPDLFTRIQNMKARDGNKAVGYSLMRLEGQIMIKTVLKEFWTRFPDAFALSLHDAIYTKFEHAAYLYDSIRNAFQKQAGIVPVVQVTPEHLTIQKFLVA